MVERVKEGTANKDQLEDLRRRLVDTGSRNRLVHINRKSKRSNSINIIKERADDVFKILRMDGKKMQFASKDNVADEDETPEDQDDIILGETDDFGESRYTDDILQTTLTSDGLQKRLLRIARDSKTAEDEQGLNILYLAIGFLSWYEDENSKVKREAPLVLLPVALHRNRRTSTYDIKSREDDIVVNRPLQKRLKEDFRINLPEIEEDEEWTPCGYFDRVEEATENRPRWEIDRDGMQLGFFSFFKLLMWEDLDSENWEQDSLAEHDLVGKLLGEGFASEPPLFAEDARLDNRLQPADIFQVVDADASQTKVIEEVRSGRNLVVQGPPGTGKSQTITNILASAANDGKKVLFIAEKMAALEVVHKRMSDVGLRDICLELHSRNANKRAVLGELKRTLSQRHGRIDTDQGSEELLNTRDRLNNISDLLHDKLPGHDYSPFDVLASMAELLGGGVPPPRLNVEKLHDLTDTRKNEITEHIKHYVKENKEISPQAEHSFFGAKELNLSPPDRRRLETEINDAIKSIDGLLSKFHELARQTGLGFDNSIHASRNIIAILQCMQKPPTNFDENLSVLFLNSGDRRLGEGISAGDDWQCSKEQWAGIFNETAWAYPVESIRRNLAVGVGSWFARIFGNYRRASAEFSTLLQCAIPATPTERIALVDRLVDIQKKRALLKEDETYLSEKLAATWRGERTDFSALKETLEWMEEIKNLRPDISESAITQAMGCVTDGTVDFEYVKTVADGASHNIQVPLKRLKLCFPDNREYACLNLVALKDRLGKMRVNTDQQYGEWTRFAHRRQKLEASGLDHLIEMLDDGHLATGNAVDEFHYATTEARWKYAEKQLPALNELKPENMDRSSLVKKFQQLETRRIKDTQTHIREKHIEQLPKGGVGEMGFLHGEMGKKRGHKPIRKIMQAAGSVIINRIKPVLLMSPVSVAQFLPRNQIRFDLLVIDEASQVRPEDAFGAVARAGQIVVVGDQKQLPPTSFFTRLTDNIDDDEDEYESEEASPVTTAGAGEMESILTLCEARGLSQRMLEWHYRSRDPSLIAVSNEEFYGNRLILPPSPLLTGESGLKFRRVPGVYSSRQQGGGRPGTNRIEAEAVASVLAEHARQQPNLSIGVVTFSKAQADMMNEVLEWTRRKDGVLDQFLSKDKMEDTFVKNIENVQGDERDVILISVGYGPREPGGRLAGMRFGPINTEGGARRLNVLFSRARIRCEVFASFLPGDINLSRTTAEGARVLQRFLKFAKDGQLQIPKATGEEADSPFEEDVARVIESFGYEATPQVGSAGFKIDIGVRHPDRPGKYILAVECDGATYHSALWARERDRLRQEILEGLGWRFHRVWSTDWFHRREYEIARLDRALDKAKQRVSDTPDWRGANDTAPTNTPPDPPPPVENADLAPIKSLSSPYQKASFTSPTAQQPHELLPPKMSEFVVPIVEVEGPVHTDEIARRIANGFGKNSGRRIKASVCDGLHHAKQQGQLKEEVDFWFTPEQEANCPVRDRSGESAPTTRAQYLSDMEIRAAAKLIEAESGKVETEEMMHGVIKLFGFKRAGPDLKGKVRSALQGRDLP